MLRVEARKVSQCGACRKQTSLIAGTASQGADLALSVWFLAIYFISQAKTGLVAIKGFDSVEVSRVGIGLWTD